MFDAMRSDKGAITLSDIFIVLISAIFIGAVAVPFMLEQQSDMHQRSAALTARSVAVEVETFLLSNVEDAVPAEVPISHNAGLQVLNIPLVTVANLPEANVPFTLSSGLTLPAANPSNAALEKANIIVSRNQYCIAVRSFGQIAFHNQDGPATSCSAPVGSVDIDAPVEEGDEATVTSGEEANENE